MALPVSATFDANATMARAFPNIRLFEVTTGWASREQADFPPPYNKTTEVGGCGPYIQHSRLACNTWQAAVEPSIVGSASAVCFFTATHLADALPAGTVFGLVHASYVGTDMQTWTPPEAIAQCAGVPPPPSPTPLPSYPPGGHPAIIPSGYSSLWNGMIHPIVGFGIRGVLWNQGEANMGWTEAVFACLFEAQIAAWRARWGYDFFWGFVQLGTQPVPVWPSYLSGVRLGQSDALPGRSKTNRSAMAVAYDVGDHAGVHARNKTVIGQRLARALLHVEWGMDLPALDWAPPALASAVLGADGAATFTFATASGAGVFLNDTRDCWDCCARGRDDVQLFALAAGGVVREYVNTTLRLVSGTELVATPVAPSKYGAFTGATFARALWPQCAVFGVSNYEPLQPFRVNLTAAAGAAQSAPAGRGP